MSKIGVFICHCGEDISATVDCEKVAETAGEMEGVAYATDYKYMCFDPGQTLIKNTIKEYGLDGVVIAACSPRVHEPTFRRACAEAGLNPYLCEIVNVREHCSWVHEKGETTTHKAVDTVKSLAEKVKRNHPLVPTQVPITKRALVIGGGVAGIQAGLDTANCGHQVILVEKESSIGGHVSQFSETFPTLDYSQRILASRMVEVAQYPNITLHTYAEPEHVEGFIGNFKVSICLKAKSIDEKLCTGRGSCTTKYSNKKVPSKSNAGLGMRTAIYAPLPQTVPNKPVIDKEHCTHYRNNKCGVCEKLCPTGAIRFGQEDRIITEEVGAVVVTTGFNVSDTDFFPEYGYGKYKDVITGLQSERLASASGSTFGEIRRSSDGQTPQKIVLVACTSSRDPVRGTPYCSKICCIYTAKHAVFYQHKARGGESYVLYMDVRAGGKNYEELVRHAIEEDGVNYVRGRATRIYGKNGKLIVKGVGILLGALPVEIEVDMVVLTTAGVANKGTEELAQKMHVFYDPYQSSVGPHPRLKPVETNTAGIYLAGVCQAPKDIPGTVGIASGVAVKVAGLFSQVDLVCEPSVAVVNRTTPPLLSICVGCLMCQATCPYQAIEREEIKDGNGNAIKAVAKVNPGLYQGCGTYVALCRSKPIDIQGYSNEQVYAEVMALPNH